MTDTMILKQYGFTPAQAANAMRKAPAKRTAAEQEVIRALVGAAK